MKKSKKILFKEFREKKLIKRSLKEYNELIKYTNEAIKKYREEKEEESKQFNFEMEQLHYRIRLLNKKEKLKEYTEEEIKQMIKNYRIEYEKMYPDKIEYLIFEEKGERK